MWVLPALGGAACMGGLHYILDDDQHTLLTASASAARIVVMAGALAAIFLLILGKPFTAKRRLRKDCIGALLLVCGVALTAYVLGTAGAVATGVLHLSMVVAFGLEVVYDHAVLDWPTMLGITGLGAMNCLTAYYFGKANP